MPLYEYRCEQCHQQFETTQSVYARVEDTECPHCHAHQATRLLSAFSSNVTRNRKPGFADIKAKAMNEERMHRFAKLPPLDAKRNIPTPNVTSESDAMSGGGSQSDS